MSGHRRSNSRDTARKGPGRLSIEDQAAMARRQHESEHEVPQSFFHHPSFYSGADSIVHRPVAVRPMTHAPPAPIGREKKKLDIRNYAIPGRIPVAQTPEQYDRQQSLQSNLVDVKPDLHRAEVAGGRRKPDVSPTSRINNEISKRPWQQVAVHSGLEPEPTPKFQRVKNRPQHVQRDVRTLQKTLDGMAPLQSRKENMVGSVDRRTREEQARGPGQHYMEAGGLRVKQELGTQSHGTVGTSHASSYGGALRQDRWGARSPDYGAWNANTSVARSSPFGDLPPSPENVKPIIAYDRSKKDRSPPPAYRVECEDEAMATNLLPIACLKHRTRYKMPSRPQSGYKRDWSSRAKRQYTVQEASYPTLNSYVEAPDPIPSDPPADVYNEAYDSLDDSADELIKACQQAEQQHLDVSHPAPEQNFMPRPTKVPGHRSVSPGDQPLAKLDNSMMAAKVEWRVKKGKPAWESDQHTAPSLVAKNVSASTHVPKERGRGISTSRLGMKAGSRSSQIDMDKVREQEGTTSKTDVAVATVAATSKATSPGLPVHQDVTTIAFPDTNVLAPRTTDSSPSQLNDVVAGARDDIVKGPELLKPYPEKPPQHNGRPTWATDKSIPARRTSLVFNGVLHLNDNKIFQEWLDPFFDMDPKVESDRQPVLLSILHSVTEIRLDVLPSAHSRAYVTKLTKLLMGAKTNGHLFPNVKVVEFGHRASLALARILQTTWELHVRHAYSSVESEVEKHVESGLMPDRRLDKTEYMITLRKAERQGVKEAVAAVRRIADDLGCLASPIQLVFPTEASHRLTPILFDRYLKRCNNSVQLVTIQRLQHAPLVLVPGVDHFYHMSSRTYPLIAAHQRIVYHEDDDIDELDSDSSAEYPVTDIDRERHRQKLNGSRRATRVTDSYLDSLMCSVSVQTRTISELDPQVAKRLRKTLKVITAPSNVQEVPGAHTDNLSNFWREFQSKVAVLLKANIEVRRDEEE